MWGVVGGGRVRRTRRELSSCEGRGGGWKEEGRRKGGGREGGRRGGGREEEGRENDMT